jgi:hypothetical protein
VRLLAEPRRPGPSRPVRLRPAAKPAWHIAVSRLRATGDDWPARTTGRAPEGSLIRAGTSPSDAPDPAEAVPLAALALSRPAILRTVSRGQTGNLADEREQAGRCPGLRSLARLETARDRGVEPLI